MERTNIVYANVVSSTQTTVTNTVYQYDYGLEQCISGVHGTATEVHFSIDGASEAMVREPYIDENGNVMCSIPDALLKQSKNIRCYIIAKDETSGTTLYEILIPVTAKARAVSAESGQVTTDKTQTKNGCAADAKVVGDRLKKIENNISRMVTPEEKLLLLELLKTAVYQSNTANQNYSKLLAAWESDVSELADARPQIVSVTPDKTSLTVGESVTFTVVQKNAKSVRFIVDEQVNERIYDVTQETISFSKTFQNTGDRIIAFQAVDADGNLGLESTRLTISVKEA